MSTGMQLERSEVKMSGYYNNWSVSDMDKYVKVPLSDEDARSLKSGDYVYLTGTIYTARDAAHKRMQEALDRGEALPIGMKNNVIYYMGPSPAREGRPIGSAGPTTASRIIGSGTEGDDRKRKKVTGSPGCHCKKRSGILCSRRWCRSTFVPRNYFF